MKYKLPLILIFNFLFCFQIIGQDMYPLIIKKDGKYGYIDSVGNLVIPNKYKDAYEFIEGIACVKFEEKWEIINNLGADVTNNKYEKLVYSHDNGIALFQNNDTLIYVNLNGKEIFKIKAKNEDSRIWSEGYHAININGKWGVIDTTGKIIVPAIYPKIGDVHEGLIYVEILPEDDFYSFINNEGKEFKTKNYDSIINLRPCYNPIERNDIGWIINLKNEKVFKLPKGDNFWGFHEGWSTFTKENGQATFIDKKRNLFGKEYFETEEFTDGISRIAIKISSNTLDDNLEITDTLIDQCTGKEIYFVDNLNKDRKLNYIDLNGNLLNNELYDGAYLFVGNIAVVEKNNKSGAINKKGDYVIPIKYDKLLPINNKVYQYQLNGLWGLIDVNGKLLTQPEFDDINFSSDYLAFKQKNKWGIIDTKGKIIVEPKFDYIIYINEDLKIVGYIEGKVENDSNMWYVSKQFFQDDTKLKLGYIKFDNFPIWKPTN